MRFVNSPFDDIEGGHTDNESSPFTASLVDTITALTSNGDALRQSKRNGGPTPRKLLSLPPPFTIEPGADFGESVRITPAAILPKGSIDLDWANAKNNARLFNGDIPALNSGGVVLVAKFDNSLQLAAVQPVGFPSGGIYTLYRLSSNIKLKDVRTMAARLKKESEQWWRPTELKDGGSESDPEQWWDEAEFGESVLSNALNNVHVTPSSVQIKLSGILRAAKALTVAKNAPVAKPRVVSGGSGNSADPNSSPESCLSQLKQQYYTLLYTSKSPLQYFPKTSLSRARVVFQTAAESPSSRLDLLLFLENMVVPIEECDEKYRSGLREVAQAKRGQIGIGDKINNEDLEAAIIPPACLKENEIKYVLKWLRSLSEDDAPIRSREQEDLHLGKKITELRSRETELQVILLLEILAIQSVLSEQKLLEYEKMKKAAERKRRRREKAKAGGTKDKKKRKKMDPSVLLGLLVDRLCIWHSIEAGDERSGSQQAPVQNTKDEKDHLRHFCVEIVLAYYSSRLPNICDDIRCKCTGKMKQTKEQETQDQPDRGQPEASPDVEEEVASLSASVPPGRPTLSRSSTAPTGKTFFERADSSFSASFNASSQNIGLEIAAQVSQEKEAMKTSFRGGITNTKRTADKRVVEVAKKRKIAPEADHELKDAIKNISKPNRLAVAEEMVSASAQRMKITGRKPKKTFHNPLASTTTVQVAATPRKNTRAIKLLEKGPSVPGLIAEEDDIIPSSSRAVPQSTIRQGTKRKSANPEGVEATPSKGPRVDSADYARPFSAQVVPQSVIKTSNKRKSSEIIEATPSKVPIAGNADHTHLVFHQQDPTRLNFLPSSPSSSVSATPRPAKRSLTETFKSQGTKKNIFMSSAPTNPFKTSTESRTLGKGFMNSIAETPTKPSISSKLRASLRAETDEETIASSPLQKPKPGTPANRERIARNLEDDFDDDGPSIYKQLGWDY
ncbi:hypothetical protein DRE_02126 [Drechslerella stenobrocha 248]|uniref:DNA replication regulator Sld3 C-terminal domain-containing protein n=1 Tax=Drechslerella stenobrocha 248 TaxID=1043628 RepID=W7I8F0_9PEZI|nr:hypothetical protein DRE_02126 [Drechslerella stenobrocha 248]